ncbi:MAG: hypothetical protein ACRYFZ_24170 [Janthinobacterium lividum]
METIRCKKCGTDYHTAAENLNKGKYLKCMVCLRVVHLRHAKASGLAKALLRFRQSATSLLSLLSKRDRRLSSSR